MAVNKLKVKVITAVFPEKLETELADFLFSINNKYIELRYANCFNNKPLNLQYSVLIIYEKK